MPGVELIEAVPGIGAPVATKAFYAFRLRSRLSRRSDSLESAVGPYGRVVSRTMASLFTSVRSIAYLFAGFLHGVAGCQSEAPDGFAPRRI